MKKLFFMALMAGSLAFFTAGSVYAEETAPVAPEAAPAGEAAAMPDAEAMSKMMAASMPGEMHKLLETLVGKWGYTLNMRMSPEAPLETHEGASENVMVYGGRFLKMMASATMKMNGQDVPYEGSGVMGYDNLAKEFQGVWMDSMGTGMMISKGTYDEATKTITEVGEMMCPMKGTKISFRSEVTFVDADSYTFTMYTTDEAGKEYQSMDITYKRQK